MKGRHEHPALSSTKPQYYIPQPLKQSKLSLTRIPRSPQPTVKSGLRGYKWITLGAPFSPRGNKQGRFKPATPINMQVSGGMERYITSLKSELNTETRFIRSYYPTSEEMKVKKELGARNKIVAECRHPRRIASPKIGPPERSTEGMLADCFTPSPRIEDEDEDDNRILCVNSDSRDSRPVEYEGDSVQEMTTTKLISDSLVGGEETPSIPHNLPLNKQEEPSKPQMSQDPLKCIMELPAIQSPSNPPNLGFSFSAQDLSDLLHKKIVYGPPVFLNSKNQGKEINNLREELSKDGYRIYQTYITRNKAKNMDEVMTKMIPRIMTNNIKSIKDKRMYKPSRISFLDSYLRNMAVRKAWCRNISPTEEVVSQIIESVKINNKLIPPNTKSSWDSPKPSTATPNNFLHIRSDTFFQHPNPGTNSNNHSLGNAMDINFVGRASKSPSPNLSQVENGDLVELVPNANTNTNVEGPPSPPSKLKEGEPISGPRSPNVHSPIPPMKPKNINKLAQRMDIRAPSFDTYIPPHPARTINHKKRGNYALQSRHLLQKVLKEPVPPKLLPSTASLTYQKNLILKRNFMS